MVDVPRIDLRIDHPRAGRARRAGQNMNKPLPLVGQRQKHAREQRRQQNERIQMQVPQHRFEHGGKGEAPCQQKRQQRLPADV